MVERRQTSGFQAELLVLVPPGGGGGVGGGLVNGSLAGTVARDRARLGFREVWGFVAGTLDQIWY